MKTVAIIPARGGSKGILRKNLQLLAGKPLVAHTLEQARAAQNIDRVIVSTDDAEIGAVTQACGAEVVWRPAAISSDTASSEAALLHALETLQQTEGTQPELLVFLQCTSRLTLAEDIDGVVEMLMIEKADTALAVTPFHYFLWQQDESGDGVGVNHDKQVRLLRQQRGPEYRETGTIYVMRTAGFLQAKHRFFGKTALYVMPAERCLEIDDSFDLQMAEWLLQQQK